MADHESVSDMAPWETSVQSEQGTVSPFVFLEPAHSPTEPSLSSHKELSTLLVQKQPSARLLPFVLTRHESIFTFGPQLSPRRFFRSLLLLTVRDNWSFRSMGCMFCF
jgi:hypothetical protein